MTVRVEVDQESCLSSGRCVADAPEAFQFDADEIAHSVDGGRALDVARLTSIARNCPASAIRLYEGNRPVELP